MGHTPVDLAVDNNCNINPLALVSYLTREWYRHHNWHGVTLVLTGDFLETFGGDARRFAEACGLHKFVKDGLLATGIPAHTLRRYARIADQNGIAVRVIFESRCWLK